MFVSSKRQTFSHRAVSDADLVSVVFVRVLSRLLWGSITIAFMGIHDLGALIAVRFILGCIEVSELDASRTTDSQSYRTDSFFLSFLQAGFFPGVVRLVGPFDSRDLRG